MATTLSALGVSLPARQVHEGVYCVNFHYDYNGITLSVSDVVVLGYLPQGVKVLDGQVWGGDNGGAASTFRFGVGTTDNNLSTAVTLSAAGTNRLIAFVPSAFSLSSDAEGNLRLQVIATKAVGTSTITGSINLQLLLQSPPV